MKTLYRKTGLLAASLALTAIVLLISGSQRQVYAGCGADVTWQISSVSDFRQTSDTQNGRTVETQDASHRSENHSDNGQDSTRTETYHRNADGSSHYHGEFNTSDLEGKGCYPDADGTTFRGDNTQDKDTDSKGNTKEHIEEIIEEHGKCIKAVRDREWDSMWKLVKDTGWVKTEVPCSKYNLQITFNGTKSLANMTATYGPNTILVHLEDKGSTYKGKYKSMLDGNVSGFCNGYITWPVTIEVTATKDKEFEDLVFSVKTTMDEPIPLGTCKNLSGNMKAGAIIVPQHDFRLADEGGSSVTVTDPGSPITWTYTLIQKK
jgi:hypothetical protein